MRAEVIKQQQQVPTSVVPQHYLVVPATLRSRPFIKVTAYCL
jgi:hypothetical protein